MSKASNSSGDWIYRINKEIDKIKLTLNDFIGHGIVVIVPNEDLEVEYSLIG